jgi:hypothetical protein
MESTHIRLSHLSSLFHQRTIGLWAIYSDFIWYLSADFILGIRRDSIEQVVVAQKQMTSRVGQDEIAISDSSLMSVSYRHFHFEIRNANRWDDRILKCQSSDR